VRNPTKVYAVFDCNVLIQAATNSLNSASACFRLVETKVVKLFVSEETLSELEDVLKRDFIRERFKFTDEIIKEYLNKVCDLADVLTNVPKIFSLPRDVDDEEYINLAVASESGFIVTRDNDLLYLMTGFDDTSKEFRQRFRYLKVVEPIEFLRIVEEKLIEDISINP